MRQEALVIYKTKPAQVVEIAEKITIKLPNGETARVREKDIELLHPGPFTRFDGLDETEGADGKRIKEAWELLDGETTSLREAAELAFGAWTPHAAYRIFLALKEGIYFSGSLEQLTPKSQEEVETETQKRSAKINGETARRDFLERLKTRHILTEDRQFMQDIEALALGRSEKSRTLREAGLTEEAESAHRLLLETGVWDNFVNPHPARNGCPETSATAPAGTPPAETRTDLTTLPAFAIDNEGSNDPDDAISITEENGRTILWVHVADPAASVLPETPADREARERGSTLYLPEEVRTMLSPDALPSYALGLSDESPSLTFKMTLDEGGGGGGKPAPYKIEETAVLLSRIKVTRLTYREADRLLAEGWKGGGNPIQTELAKLAALSRRLLDRRIQSGAAIIDFPDVRIQVDKEKKTVEILPEYECELDQLKPEWVSSAEIVRECMLAAVEGAALWALHNQIPFPYISQETGDTPGEIAPGYAGAYQLRRLMRPRTLSTKPGLHWALGLDLYTQVTSPLRRYTDLLCHQQIRAFLTGKPLLSSDEVLTRLLQAERGASASQHAQRSSNNHWKQVYLSGKKGETWDAVLLEKRKPRSVALIPALGIETQIPLSAETENLSPGDTFRVTLLKANIASGEAGWGCTG
jgi:exoribonuclease-2